jgi:hypothetical protein
MLSEAEIAKALHASRVVTLPALNPHGPLGLEQLAADVARLRHADPARTERVQRPIALSVETWEKLDQLARAATPANAPPLTASALAAALLEQAVVPK